MTASTAWLLVTGSRDWQGPDRRDVMRTALQQAWDEAREAGCGRMVVVHGAARGADSMAVAWTKGRPGVLEVPVVPDWDGPCGKRCRAGHRRKRRDGSTFCPAAGNYRNQRMVDHVRHQAGMKLVLAFFAAEESTGTADCLERAVKARLPWRRFDAWRVDA